MCPTTGTAVRRNPTIDPLGLTARRGRQTAVGILVDTATLPPRTDVGAVRDVVGNPVAPAEIHFSGSSSAAAASTSRRDGRFGTRGVR